MIMETMFVQLLFLDHPESLNLKQEMQSQRKSTESTHGSGILWHQAVAVALSAALSF